MGETGIKRLRISAISYLNTAPLMWDFEHGNSSADFEIAYTVPAECARDLESGRRDIGIIPSAAYAMIPGLSVLPGVAIASKQSVRSILLVSTKPIDEIESVALDRCSLTSAALARILFEKFWGGRRRFSSAAPDLEAMLAAHDAALLIGDPALKIDRSRYHTWDLSEEWIRWTGKAFVFAFWAVRQDALNDSPLDLAGIFQASRDHGLEPENLAIIARTWAAKLALAQAEILEYLKSNIYYYLDPDCLEGLELFYRYARDCGILPEVSPIQFLERKPAVI